LREPDGEFFDQHTHLLRNEVSLSYANISKCGFDRRLKPAARTLIEGMVVAGLGEYHQSTDCSVKGIFSPQSIFDSMGVRHSAAHLLPQPGA
jgi:hypothetical protein